MTKKILALALGILLIAAMAACGNGGQTQPPPTGGETPAATNDGASDATAEEVRPVRLGLVTQSQGNPFHIQLRQAAVAYAEERGIEIVVLASESLEEQLRVMEDLAQTRPDAIAVTAYDAAAIVTAMEAAKALGVYVFAIDNNVLDTDIVAFTGTDNVYGGEIATDWLIDRVGVDGNIGLILGAAGSFASNARQEGFYNTLYHRAPDMNVKEVTANWQRELGLIVANDLLIANPDLDAIFGLNDNMALGAVQAVEETGRSEVLVMGFNGTPDAVVAVYNGELDATVVQFPALMVQTYVDLAIDLVRYGIQPAQRDFLIPAFVIDTELVRAVVDDGKQPTNAYEELLFPKLIDFVTNW